MQNADEVQAGIKIVGRNINNLRYANNTTLMAEGDSLVAQLVKNPPAVQETRFDPWVGKIHWRRKWQPIPVFLLENPRDRFAWWAITPPALKALSL